MNFNSASVNNCYILRDEVFENLFFTYLNAKAIYSASIFHLAFLKADPGLIPMEHIKKYQKLSIDLYQLNSPYLYIPFEINFHERKLYQSYYESDHFPLSLWIEEKSLIPFNIFIRIMEDTLTGLQILEKAGHSHLFLTPEEILIPLQWDSNKQVKLYNIGINLLAPFILSPKEIEEYRKNYKQGTNKLARENQIQNIAIDLYSFGMIMIQIFSLCNFDTETDKEIIQKKLFKIINEPESFNSINDAISLFDDFFIEKNRKNILPEKSNTYSYSGQAGYIIPEFYEWKEEAKLEPVTDEIELKVNHLDDELQPMEVTKENKPIIDDLKTCLKNEVESLQLHNLKQGGKSNLLIRIPQYLKRQYRRLLHK